VDAPGGELLPSSRPGDHETEGMDEDQGQSSPKRHRVKPFTGMEVAPNQRQEEEVDRQVRWAEEWEQGGNPQRCTKTLSAIGMLRL